MRAFDNEVPLFDWQLDDVGAAIGASTGVHSAKNEGPGITWIVQDLQDTRMLRLRPDEFAFVGTIVQARGELQTLLPNEASCLHRAARSIKSLEQHANGVLHFNIGNYSSHVHRSPGVGGVTTV